MDQLENQIKTSLNEHAFNNIKTSKEEKTFFINSIKSNTHLKKSRVSWRFIPLTVAAILVLLISSVLLKSFSNNESDSTASIQKEAIVAFGRNVTIPIFEGFQIKFAALTMLPLMDHPTDLIVYYSNNKGDMDPAFNEEKERKQWEKNQKSKILYGPYTGKEAIKIEYRPGKVEGATTNGYENKTINGIPLQYEYIKKESVETILVFVNYNEGAYILEIRLGKEFKKKDGDQVVERFIEQLKQK